MLLLSRAHTLLPFCALGLLACGGETATAEGLTTGGGGAVGTKSSSAGGAAGGTRSAGSSGQFAAGRGGSGPGGAGAWGARSGGAGGSSTGAGQGGAKSGGAGGDVIGAGGGVDAAAGASSGIAGAGGTGSGPTGTAGKDGAGGKPPAPTKIEGPTLRVASFNIRLDTASDGEDQWSKRKPIFFAVFKGLDADLVGVQEAQLGQLEDIDKAMPAYDRIGLGRDGGHKGEHSAIYYRKARFEVKGGDTFWLSPTPEQAGSKGWDAKFPRICTWGRFEEKDTGYHFYHFNAHFDHVGDTARQKSAQLVMKRIDARNHPNEPFFFTGDLNADEESPVTHYLEGKSDLGDEPNPVPLRDTFREVFPNTKESGTAHGFDSDSKTGAKIDYVFIEAKLGKTLDAGIDHTKIDGRYPSDHYPIWGVVKLPDQG